MSDLKRGTFGSVMEGLEDEVEDIEIVPEPADEVEDKADIEADAEETTEEVTEDSTEESEEEEEDLEEDAEEESEEEESTEEGEEEKKEEDDDDPITWTVKVDGNEEEVDEEELLRGYQTAKSSTKRFSEAKKLHTEAQTFFKKFLEDPGTAMTDYMSQQHGGDRVKARQEVQEKFLEFLAPAIEEMNIEDERERELFRKKRELDEQQRELDNRKAEAKNRLDREAEDEFIVDVRTQITKQIKKFKLPTDDVIWEQAGKFLSAAESAGSTRDEILELVPTVMKRIKEDRVSEAKRLASTLTPEEIEDLYPEQMAALKKKRVERLKKKKQGKAKKKVQEEVEPQKPKKKKRETRKAYRSDDVFNSIDLSEFED